MKASIMELSNAKPLVQARDPCLKILACVLTSWSALTRRVDWRLVGLDVALARADSSSVGATSASEERAVRHERERHADKTFGREAHDEPVDDHRLRVQRWANLVGAASAVTDCFHDEQIVFSGRDLHTWRGCGIFQCLSRFGLQPDVSGSTRSGAGVFWSAMVCLIRSMTIKARS